MHVSTLSCSHCSTSYHIAVCWFVVLSGAEASQSLLEHEYAEWVT